jgi:hypothetical protein
LAIPIVIVAVITIAILSTLSWYTYRVHTELTPGS